jgi:hypothetical protein
MEIKDLAGLSEPLKKLIEVVAQGAGAVYTPYLLRKTAEAEAYKQRLLTDAKAYEIRTLADSTDYARQKLGRADFQNEELALISPPEGDPVKLLAERAVSRREFQNAVEQDNIEEITSYAAEELSHEETVSSESVDPDWIHRFFDIARGISNEEMQMIWGKILAGEVKRPDTYSLRTLELLKNLSKAEAETFVKVAKFGIKVGEMAFFINLDYLKTNHDVNYLDILLLKELGILNTESSQFSWSGENLEFKIWYCIYAQHVVLVDYKDENPSFSMEVQKFTRIGYELINLIDPIFDLEYVSMFAKYITRGKCKIMYRKLNPIGATEINYDDMTTLIDHTEDQ